MLSSHSAITEPFADFTVDTGLLWLGISRTYTSNDWSYAGGPLGVFGRGWHHDWEAWLTCSGTKCTVARGAGQGHQFTLNGTALSLDGTETWQIYVLWSNEMLSDTHQNILARRPSGEWIMYDPEGAELHFDTVCDACSGSDVFCQDATAGGKARLKRVVNARGNSVQLAYNRPGGVPLALTDDLGHSLQLQSTSACTDGLVSSLQYDGATVATYTYVGSDLTQATDADGNVLRSYTYDTGYTERLLAVKNESGAIVASFAYDSHARAIGIIDKRSSVQVDYDAPSGIQVTEFYGSTSATGTRMLNSDGKVTSISDGCACGPAKAFMWKNRRLVCTADALGHLTWQDFDVQGRVTYRAEYSGSSCPSSSPVNSLDGTQSREEWYGYGVSKPIVQGINLSLNVVSSLVKRRPNMQQYVAESLSYDPTPSSIDPPGYSCQGASLPAGSVLCRKTEQGYTYRGGSLVSQRYVTFYSYDGRGRLIKTLGPINIDYSSASDVMPVEERVYWPDADTLTRRGRLKELKRYASPTGPPLVTAYDYDAFGAYQITQPLGAMTTIVKDGRGRPVVVVGPDGQSRQTRYHDGLDPRLQIMPSGAAVRYGYDGTGRLLSVEHLSGDPEAPGANTALGWGEYYTYDAAGNRTHTERRDAAGTVTWQQNRQYDVQHRLVSETNPENPATARTNLFDASGFLRSVTDEEGRVTTYTPDGLNRVAKVTRSGVDAAGASVSLDVAVYTYPKYADHISKLVDGVAGITSYEYDEFGRVVSVGSNNLRKSQWVKFTYDARGNLLERRISFTNASGWGGSMVVSYTYDGLDRVLTLKATNTEDNSSIAYTYRYDEPGGVGQLTSVVEPERTVSFGYDTVGRLIREMVQENGVSVALVTQYSYDVDGAVSDLVYPSGLHVQLIRDPATREVVQVKNVADNTLYADQVTHLPGGPIKNLTFGNGLALSQTFNRRYEPQTISSGPTILGYGMTPAGDIQSVAEGGTTRTFQYDFLDRLTGSPGWLAYAYDNNGNRFSQTVDGNLERYIFFEKNDVLRWRASSDWAVAQYGYAYDYQASMTGIGKFNATGDAVTAAMCLRHDALGRLTLVGSIRSNYLSPNYFGGGIYCTSDGYIQTVTARFKYDSRNRRVAAWSAATNQWTYIISDAAGNPLSEMVKTGDPQNPWMKYRDYVWLDGKPLAQIEYPGPAGSTQGYVNYFHLDHIGLPRALTNANQQTIWSATARPYGDIVENTTTDPLSGRTIVTNLRLPGQYDERLLSSLGLQGPYYNWNRWYLPGVGRYLELDPIALRGKFNAKWGPDWYGYAGGNPLRRVDPRGLSESDYQDCVWNCELAMAGCLLVGGATCYATGPFIPYCWSQVGVCCIILEQACEKNCESRRNE